MSSCQCQGIERYFTDDLARDALKTYRKEGAGKPTQMLIDALSKLDIKDASLLDIGGGGGAIQLELLEKGFSSAVGVDGSTGYLGAAQEEAEARGVLAKITHRHGNFVDIAPDLESADVVTLDKVICCFDDMQSLVSSSVHLAKRYYGLVFPVNTWWMRTYSWIENLYMRIRKNPFRSFSHATEDVEKIIFENGFKRFSYQRQSYWQVVVYAR